MKHPIPAPGFRLISGKRNPPDGENVRYVPQFRNGIVSEHSWPVRSLAGFPGPRWVWGEEPDDWDVVAVKRA